MRADAGSDPLHANRPDAAAITVAILAGGRGERMGGVDKGLLPLHGRVLVEWVLDALAGQGIERRLIVANRSFDAYARRAPTIGDTLPGQPGPLAGIAAALAACTSPWLLSVPVDCPAPPPDLVARLGAAMRDGMHAAVVADDGEHRQPLFALYARTLAESAAAGAAAGLGVWAWQDTIPARVLDFSDRRAHFANLNTRAELDAYLENGDG